MNRPVLIDRALGVFAIAARALGQRKPFGALALTAALLVPTLAFGGAKTGDIYTDVPLGNAYISENKFGNITTLKDGTKTVVRRDSKGNPRVEAVNQVGPHLFQASDGTLITKDPKTGETKEFVRTGRNPTNPRSHLIF